MFSALDFKAVVKVAVGIGINKSSLMAQRRLGEATAQNSKISEQLSSGLRINRASDDAAGLAISTALNANSKVFTQGIRNLNDGISLIAVADSAVSTLTEITTRLTELANQASNGSYSGAQRSALDAEAQALSKEFARVVQSTKFNNTNILNGGLSSGLRLQAGYGTEGAIFSNLGGAMGTGNLNLAGTVNSAFTYTGMTDLSLADIDGDGDLDMLGISTNSTLIYKNDGKGNFGAATVLANSGTGFKAEFADFNGDGKADIVSASIVGASAIATIRLGNGDGTFASALNFTLGAAGVVGGFSVGDFNNDNKLDLVVLSDAAFSSTAYIALGNGDGSLNSATSYSFEGSFVTIPRDGDSLKVGDLNGDGILDLAFATGGYYTGSAKIQVRLGSASGTFGAINQTILSASGYTSAASFVLGDFDGDGVMDAVTHFGTSGLGQVLKGNGNGTFTATSTLGYLASSSTNMEAEDMNGDGFLDLVQTGLDGGWVSVSLGRGDGTFQTSKSINASVYGSSLAVGDIDGDGVNDLVRGELDGGTINVYKGVTQTGNAVLLDFSLKTVSEAKAAQSVFSQKLNQLSQQRGQIGAFQSRTEVAIGSLTSMREQYNAASSRIQDVDVASAAGEYIRTQILQQAATAILAQANQSPRIGLQLLQSQSNQN